MVGATQWLVLEGHTRRSGWCVLASAAGFGFFIASWLGVSIVLAIPVEWTILL